MTATIAIATEKLPKFQEWRSALLAAGPALSIAEADIAPAPLITTEQVRDWLEIGGRRLLVLDAELPPEGRVLDTDERAEAVEDLLVDLRLSGITTPMLVLTPRKTSYPSLEGPCTPENCRIQLPLDMLKLHRSAILKPFLLMLLGERVNGGRIPGTFDLIEIDFTHAGSVCHLGSTDGERLLVWNTLLRDVKRLRGEALNYADEEIYRNRLWPLRARSTGEQLFFDHVVDSLGEGLYAHIERAAGGLNNLAFRYVITDTTLYGAPFETAVRPAAGGEDAAFVILRARTARRWPTNTFDRLPQQSSGRIPRRPKVLLIRSQLADRPDSGIGTDVVQVPIRSADGTVTFQSLELPRLNNIDLEKEYLADLHEAGKLELELLDLSVDAAPGMAAKAIETKVADKSYDIIHYAGHAWNDRDDAAYLILPGAAIGEAESLSLDIFSRFKGLNATRLVYLSACRGLSRGSVHHLVVNGIAHAVGFRYVVDDTLAAIFAQTFYDDLVNKGELVPHAFRAACAGTRDRLKAEGDSPIWISPILLAQTRDWAMA